MNTLLWILQTLAASIFMYSGINKSLFSERKLVGKGQTGVEGLPIPVIRFIGIIEILGSVGLILPGILRIWPALTPISATGFCIIMLLAARIHYRRKEPKNVLTNMILLGISAFIAIYRSYHPG